MSHTSEQTILRQEQFDTLRAIIYAHVGIHFPDAKKALLASRLSRRVSELNLESYDQYVQYLTIAPDREQELQEMLSRVTINHTSFFRDPQQLAYLRDTALPQLIEARRRERTLRVWSAACSTGEEPYTLAILIHQALGERLPDWRIEVLGTDVSARALAAAEQARYPDDAIRAVDPVVRVRYFRQDGPFWTIDPLVRSLVSFDIHNLKDRLGAKRYGAWDAVVCRNALIYFDDAMRARVAAMFADQLKPGGWLAVGASESLQSLDVPLTADGDGPARLYRPAFPPSAQTAAATGSTAPPAKPGRLRLA
ncbi:MAG TPA: protein-glutamate O-methyltransferase CheR [Phycisphaerales bacterium]|nr:protein-glutamate O-methyltransferase CheR [Phycisphaerales bacterium]